MVREALQNSELILEFLVRIHSQTAQIDDLDGNCLPSDIGLPQVNRGEGSLAYDLVDVVSVVFYCFVEVLVPQHPIGGIL